MSEDQLHKAARKALQGVGNPQRGTWTERHNAYHLRRRLSEAEQARVGDVQDLRQTPEGWARLRAVVDVLPPRARQLGVEEWWEAPR